MAIKLEVFKSSNSEDWFCRFRSGAVVTEFERSFNSHAKALRYGKNLVLVILDAAGVTADIVRFNEVKKISEVTEVTWFVSIEALRGF